MDANWELQKAVDNFFTEGIPIELNVIENEDSDMEVDNEIENLESLNNECNQDFIPGNLKMSTN